MTLDGAVKKYLAVAGGYGQLMPLSSFDLPAAELGEMISAWEEDYHLSRHYELIPASFRDPGSGRHVIDGIEYSGIIFHPSIQETLGQP